jgi:hypothetical protein
MKEDKIIADLEQTKERLAATAGYDTRRFLDNVDAWLAAHPHPGPVVTSPEELQARIRGRDATEGPAPPPKPYRVYDPIVAEVHRIRARLAVEKMKPSVVRETPPPPPRKRKS